MVHVLMVEDDARFREAAALALSEVGFTVTPVGSEEEAVAALAARPDIALLDLGLPDPEQGFRTLGSILAKRPELPVIVITGEKDMGSHVRAMRDGAFDYVTKPVSVPNLEAVINRALKLHETRAETSLGIQEALPSSEEGGPALLGESSCMRGIFKTLGLLAGSRATVLLRGESGTGKELAAQTLHRFSRSANRPFVAVNCAALPGTLIEAELFGYRRGAFTGADRDRAGKLEAAEDGTLFLDEIGDVPLEVQVKLLRVLQERRYERLGETEPRSFNARIVAATHRDLEGMVRAGKFREDLYFRLNVASVTIPPLRERREDVPVLTRVLLGDIGREIGRTIRGLSQDALGRLIDHDWPGNVRELRNALTRAALKARGPVISAEDLDLRRASSPDDPPPEENAPVRDAGHFPTLDDVEREHIRRALARSRGHRGRTCELLGISRPTLLRKLKRYAIEVASSSASA